MELERDQFEEVALAHFVAQRADGVQISGDNGCEPTRESLFWRDDKGDYGVRMFNAAWWGWKEAAVATRKTCEVPSLDEAALARLAITEEANSMLLARNKWLEHTLEVAGASPVEPSLARAVEPFEVDWPEYHQRAMGCGLEDRGIRDRYEAMQYGWDQAIERVAERLPETLYATPQAAAQPPAPGEAAREYMTGYSDGREWAKPERAEDSVNAKRYLWLRDEAYSAGGETPFIVIGRDDSDCYVVSGKTADEAIDAAIKQGGQHD